MLFHQAVKFILTSVLYSVSMNTCIYLYLQSTDSLPGIKENYQSSKVAILCLLSYCPVFCTSFKTSVFFWDLSTGYLLGLCGTRALSCCSPSRQEVLSKSISSVLNLGFSTPGGWAKPIPSLVCTWVDGDRTGIQLPGLLEMLTYPCYFLVIFPHRKTIGVPVV